MTGRSADIRVHAVAVTFGRPHELIRTLDAYGRQTRPPDSVLVVDNAADDDVRRLVEGREGTSYLAMDENLGPAGGITAGFDVVVPEAAADDWVLLIDDDDPPLFDTAVADVVDAARRAPPDVAVVGLTGARYDRWTGVLRRLRDDQLQPFTDVDYVGNGQCPLYRVRAIDEVGGPDPDLFFQFEELEFGLRLRRHGWRLVVDRDVTLRTREASGRLGLGRRARPARRTSAWRSYYSARNQVLIARREGAIVAPVVVSARITAGGLAQAVRTRSSGMLGSRLRGLIDGWLGRLGRTVEPSPTEPPRDVSSRP